MSEIKTIENRVVMNEYLEVSVKPDLVQLCSDCYHALGWTIINSCSGIDTEKLKLQRDRKIRNRVALCDLQRKCEDAFINIEKLERSKNTRAMALALGAGIVGTVLMASSTFAYLAAMIHFPFLISPLIPSLTSTGTTTVSWGIW